VSGPQLGRLVPQAGGVRVPARALGELGQLVEHAGPEGMDLGERALDDIQGLAKQGFRLPEPLPAHLEARAGRRTRRR